MACTNTTPTEASATLGSLPPLISVDEAAGVLNVSRRHVARLCERGELKAVKLGKVWRINRDALAKSCGLE